MRILIVDDEEPIRRMVSFIMETEGFSVSEASCKKEVYLNLEKNIPNLVLLDWMLPDCSGLELARELKVRYPELPLIMLTAKAEEDSKIKGLENADDYVIKPFSPRELIARIRAVLRRSQACETEKKVISFGRMVLDNDRYQLTIDGQPVKLGPKEFHLIRFFIENPDRVYSREDLLDRVWGKEVYVGERTVDVHIRRLRKILEQYNADRYITTLHGVGYSLRHYDCEYEPGL